LGTRELLSYLEKLEIGLSSFSYEELGTVEAGELKKSFEMFKHGLEDKVFGVSEIKQLEEICQRAGIQGLGAPSSDQQRMSSKQLTFIKLVNALENTPLNNAQRELVKALRTLAHGQDNKKNIGNSMPAYFQTIERNLDPAADHSISLKSVLQECMGQMDLMEELVRMFRQNVLEFIGGANVHIKNEDHESLDLACQKVVPNLRMMKTFGLLETVQQMAILCRTDKDMKHLSFLYNQFLAEFPNVDEQVDFEMQVLRTI